MTNDEIIIKMKEHVKLRNLSSWTEIEYMDKLKSLLRYYENMPIEEMNETHLRAFLLYLLNEKKLAVATVNIYNSAFRFIFGAVMERNLNYQMIPRSRVHRELPKL